MDVNQQQMLMTKLATNKVQISSKDSDHRSMGAVSIEQKKGNLMRKQSNEQQNSDNRPKNFDSTDALIMQLQNPEFSMSSVNQGSSLVDNNDGGGLQENASQHSEASLSQNHLIGFDILRLS